MKKKKLLIISTLIIISLLITGCGKKAELKDGAEVAVSVKGGQITATEYYEKIKENNISELIDMIDHELLDESYKTDDDEDDAVKKQMDQVKSNYGSDKDTYKAILLQYFGVNDEKEFEEMLRLEYKRNKAVKDYVKSNLTDKEIEKYYDENIYAEMKASHILISVDVDDNATQDEKDEANKVAENKAKEVIQKLKDGAKFSDLAKEYSTDESNNEKGGDLGYFDPNDMPDEFRDAIVKLEKDEYTKEPIKTKFGYHIILKTGEKEKESLEKVRDEIKETLAEQKISEDNSIYYQSLVKFRESKEIKWNDSALEKAYNDYMDNLIEQSKPSSN